MNEYELKRNIFIYHSITNLEGKIMVDKSTMIVLSSMIVGLVLFGGFELLTIFNISPLGIAFNNFFTMVGVIIFFIAGFFYLSLKTVQQQ